MWNEENPLTKIVVYPIYLINIMYCRGIIPESVIGKGGLGNVTATIQTALVSKFGSLLFLFLFS